MSITVNGTATDLAILYVNRGGVSITGNCYISGIPEGSNNGIIFNTAFGKDSNAISFYPEPGIVDSNDDIDTYYIAIKKYAVLNDVVFKPMLVKGSEPLPFEPYKSTEITVSSNMQLPAAGLKTFDGVTHVFSNCDFTMDYFLSREQGAANAGLQNDINAIKMILDSITPEMLEKLKKL